MTNLLLDESLWDKQSAKFSAGAWSIDVHGSFGMDPNGQISLIADAPNSASLSGSVLYEVNDYTFGSDLWLVVIAQNDVKFSHKFWSAGSGGSTSGSFELLADVSNMGWATVGVSSSEFSLDSPIGYDAIASVSIVPTQDPPAPPEPEPSICEELGRATRAYVSGYDRARVHRSRLIRGDRRCLIAEFNGAIPLSRRIVSATWRTNQAYASILSDARIVGREVAVDMTAGSGLARIKCVASLDNGEVYSQLFIVRAIGGPWFQGEVNPSAGPNELTATAP